MFKFLAKKIFGSANEKFLSSIKNIVTNINELEASISKLSDTELSAQTQIFKKRLTNGEHLDHILPEAFATVREAAKRVLGMRHFDVQLIGGIVLHQGKIAEMKTGEGKTLVATAPVYLNALTGLGVHVVTVNDYLAKRDSEWMGKIYQFLGLTVECIINELDDGDRRKAYSADITYGTNNEFGFDYLRDNLKHDLEHMVQRPFQYAIVDEVDSILIDEARTPLIISGPATDRSDIYTKIDKIIKLFKDNDIEIDEKSRSVNLTEEGHSNAELILRNSGIIKEEQGLYDLENMNILHHLTQALKAHKIFKKDVDYMIKNGNAMLIDEFTGRVMEGRRYSEGLHQAIEAKEKIRIHNENQTLASVTFQNYFRMYPKLSGMTGTAATEANEFLDIYNLQVIEIPTNIKVSRIDEDDEIYKTAEEKYEAILKEIVASHEKGQPILVGTASIEKSELLSKMLKKQKIHHNVLNAKYHEQEAGIISQAGRSGAITIATNMAGRGTDIMLGGNAESIIAHTDPKKNPNRKNITSEVKKDKEDVLNNGGLLVIGTERHESRRIDNQLRGRSGRQGDPGRTKFFLSLEDDLMRIFGSEKIGSMLTKLGLKRGEAITHPWISKSLEKAQQKVEARNYEVRKNLLKFDDVVNEQRKAIYSQRIDVMKRTGILEMLRGMIHDINIAIINRYIPKKSYRDDWDVKGLESELSSLFSFPIPIKEAYEQDDCNIDKLIDFIDNTTIKVFESQRELYGDELFEIGISSVFLQTLDQLWREHLQQLDTLRNGISLRAYGQKDPLNEYKIEAFKMFETMISNMEQMIVARCLRLKISFEPSENINDNTDQGSSDNSSRKLSRNDPCFCASGKKFKHCHGTISSTK